MAYCAAAATVKPWGEVEAFGLRFWSSELGKYAGWEVLIEMTEGDAFVDVWSKGRAHRLCTAVCIADTGFSSVEAARAVSREVQALKASVIGSDADTARGEVDRAPNRMTLALIAVGKFLCQRILQKSAKPHAKVGPKIGCDVCQAIDKRQQQDANFADVVLVHAEAILMHAQAILDAHDQPNAPSRCYAAAVEGAAKTIITHRLSETSK